MRDVSIRQHIYLHSIDNHSATRFEDLVYLYHDISARRVDDRIELYRSTAATIFLDQFSELPGPIAYRNQDDRLENPCHNTHWSYN